MPTATAIDRPTWFRLIVLSVLWGGSFLFIGVAVRELPPLTVILVRVAVAALVLWPVLKIAGLRLPSTVSGWVPFVGMGLLNNVVPMSLIATGQTSITAGLASVLNATTPIFAVIILAVSGDERLTLGRIAGVALGFAGVVVVRMEAVGMTGRESLGIALCLAAALSYGLSGLWGRRMLAGIPPLVSAAGQLTASSLVLVVLASIIEQPWTLPMPGAATLLALLGLAVMSTALAYILFFQILARSGAVNVMLVTLLVPVTAIILGHLLLGEALTLSEIIGALIIGSALLLLDGRMINAVRKARAERAG